MLPIILKIRRLTITILILSLIVSMFTSNVYAHSPSSMNLTYDTGTQDLEVEITHQVSDPNSHYIFNIVIKKNGMAGWIELSWKDEPTAEFMDKAENEVCAYCMSNVSTYQGWEKIFKNAGIKQLNVIKHPMDVRGIFSMIADETQELFDYVSGRKIVESIPIVAYKEKELHEVEDANVKSS